MTKQLKARNWLVIHQPCFMHNEQATVATMKVVAAWSSNGTKGDNESTMVREMPRIYAEHGDGNLYLVEQKAPWRCAAKV